MKKFAKHVTLTLSLILALAQPVSTYAAQTAETAQAALISEEVSAESTLTAASSANKSKSVDKKKAAFLKDKRFKNGAKYGARKPYLSPYLCTGCCAYAADFVKYVYGKKSPVSGKKFTSPKNIRGGDVLKFLNSQHWVVVISRNGSKLTTAEANWGGVVVVSSSAYTIKNGKVYRNGKRFRTFAGGWHYE